MQKQIRRRPVPIRLHHDIYSSRDTVGELVQVWAAGHPMNLDTKSLWGVLDVTEPQAAQRIANGSLPECSLDLVRGKARTALTGLMLCEKDEAFFPLARIYPNHRLPLTGQFNSEAPFSILPDSLASTMPATIAIDDAMRAHPQYAVMESLLQQADSATDPAQAAAFRDSGFAIYKSISTQTSPKEPVAAQLATTPSAPTSMETVDDATEKSIFEQLSAMQNVIKSMEAQYSKRTASQAAVPAQAQAETPSTKRAKPGLTNGRLVDLLMQSAQL